MRYCLSYVLFLYIILSYNTYAIAQQTEYGLQFKSYEVEKEKRTSLNLTPSKILSLPEIYNFSFDLKVDSVVMYPFGYVFRIINENGKHIDFLLNEKKNTGEPKFLLAHSSDEIFSDLFKDVGISYGKWVRIDININTKINTLSARIGTKSYTKQIDALNNFRQINVVFGKSNYPEFQVTDIPAMSLRNIDISDAEKKILYRWPLNKYTSNGVYDEIKHHLAICENPNWIINQHAFWQKRTSFTTKLRPIINYNCDNNEVAIYDQEHFFKYKLNDNTLTKIKVKTGVPYAVQSNNLIYNPYIKTYINYTFELEEGKDVLLYDTLRNEWSMISETKVPPDYWHHNHLISDMDSSLYLFGGYGHHKYKNDIQIYNFKTQEWRKTHLNGDNPEPRYLGGLGKLDDGHFLIFGGYGSQTGNQELSPQYFYDLYKVNMQTLESQKLWTLPSPAENFIVSNSIIVDTASNSFYALSYPLQQFHTKLTLLRFSIDKPEYEVLADSIPINFEDNKSYIDLYLDKEKQQLVALTSGYSNIGDTLNTIAVYTLSFPPLAKGNLYQKSNVRSYNLFIILAIICLIFILILILTRKKQIHTKNDVNQLSSTEEIVSKPISRELISQSVCLFGGFCVIDKKGNDVTKEFTPMLKQLFVLILLYTFKGGKGISSVKLKEILWFDKTEESAKNNRGVSLSKLRLIFDQVGQINIKSNNSYWTVEYGEEVYCDYSQALFLINKLSRSGEINIDDLKRLLAIVSVGELLPNLQVEWIDPFKSEFSNTLVDLLLDLSAKPEIRVNTQICIDLADAIFIHDSLNEDALRLKCSVLVRMGRNGLAQKAYASFVKEYNVLFGSDFEYTFDQVLNENN
ncbi:MAG: hypothetical protein LBV71_02600 [Prevotella sp.]|nr:hypothetical protein [Prevotella sp.]